MSSLSFYIILDFKDDQVIILSCYTIEKGKIRHRLDNVRIENNDVCRAVSGDP